MGLGELVKASAKAGSRSIAWFSRRAASERLSPTGVLKPEVAMSVWPVCTDREQRDQPLVFVRLLPFPRRDFGLKLRDYFPGHFAFDCKYIGDITIVTFRPDLGVRPRIDQLSVDAHSTAARWTVPSNTCATPSCAAISRRLRSARPCTASPMCG